MNREVEFECEDCGFIWDDIDDGTPEHCPVCPDCGGSNLFENEVTEDE